MIQITAEELKQIIKEAVQEAMGNGEPPRLLTRIEAAKWLGVSVVTLDQWEREGKVKSRRSGRRVRYLASDILDAMAAK